MTRCAIYTRKSTEDGLEQEFNSLDAQREACAAYVLSQRYEGWVLVPGHYDDGGFSGGTLERPGLRALLEEVRANRIDVIVVYKADRLTRSLADFAKIVETLDAADASFVSVTQAFNTITSMGRLTLNVLLSFAQFEREVTGERICDKIAASKKKGMWMGGVVPLGYDVKARKLVVNEAEAEQVRHMFERYLALGTVVALQEELAARGVVSELRTSSGGRQTGGINFNHGAMCHLIQNRTYVGEVHHRGQHFAGEHAAIIDPEMFEQAQRQHGENRAARKHGRNIIDPSLLAGLLFDSVGRRMTPKHACKGSHRYRYYISMADFARGLVTSANHEAQLELAKIAACLKLAASGQSALGGRSAKADNPAAGTPMANRCLPLVTDSDPLQRFIGAQGNTYAIVQRELVRGHKTSHWMWFIFPQLWGLGSSEMARTYAIASLDEARTYLAHPLLGSRLRECVIALKDLPQADAQEMFGKVDALKLRSSITLFLRVGGGELFEAALQRWFSGQTDERTDQLLGLKSIGIR